MDLQHRPRENDRLPLADDVLPLVRTRSDVPAGTPRTHTDPNSTPLWTCWSRQRQPLAAHSRDHAVAAWLQDTAEALAEIGKFELEID